MIGPRSLLCAGLAMLVALSACEEPDAEGSVVRARDYRDQGDISASIIELKNALQQEPKNPQARFLLGQNYLTIRDLPGAEKEFLRAREFGVPADQLAEPLAEVWLSGRQFDRLLTEIQIPESAPATTKATLAIARGRARQALGDLEGAKQEFDLALAQDSGRPVALVGLARIAMRLGDEAEIDEAVARAFEAAPEDLDVLALKGDHDFLRGEYASAEVRYQAVVDIRPSRIFVRLALARAQIFQGKTDPAKSNLDLVLARVTAHPLASYLRASLALEAKDYEGARWYSEQVLITKPNHAPSRLIAGAASYLLNQLEQAERHLSRAVAQEPEHRLARQLHAATRLRIARAGDGQVAPVPLLDDSQAPIALASFVDPEATARTEIEAGQAYFAELAGAYPEAVLIPRQTSADDDGEVRPHHQARLKYESGNETEAISLLKEALAADPYSLGLQALLGQLHFAGNRPRQTLEVIGAALRNYPEHPVLLGLKGLSHLQANRPGDAKPVFSALAEIEPGAAQAQYLLALAHRKEGDMAGYGERLDQVLRLDPGHFRATVENIRLMAQAGDLHAARDRADSLLQSTPENPEALDISGVIALLEDRTEAAIDQLRRALELAPSATAALKLAYVQQRAGRGPDSRATLTDWLQRSPGAIGVRLALANKYLAAGELEQARSQYTKIRLLTPNNVVVLNNLAWVDLQLGDLESAQQGIERARQLAPADPRVIDTYGLVRLRSGDAESAEPALRRAARDMPDSPQIQARLAQALAQQDETVEARDILRRILSENADFPDRTEAKALLRELGD